MDIISLPESSKNDSGFQDSTEMLSFQDLPTDVLLHIFKFCDLSALYALSCSCKRFYSIVSDDSVWRTRSKGVVITNQASQDIIKRSSKCLSAKQKCRISVNWKLGSYVEKYLSTKTKFMPKLLLEKHRLWMSRGENICVYKRRGNYIHWKNPSFALLDGHVSDVCNFVKLDSLLLSGDRNGRICGWCEKTGNLLFKKDCYGLSTVRCFDASKNIALSGARDSLIKVWALEDNNISGEPVSVFIVNDSLWSLAIDPTTSYFCCGTTGLTTQESIKLFNLECGTCRSFSIKRGSAVFDIKWETNSTFLTCGYDSVLRLWDIRASECVMSWMDPFDASGYCLASDKSHSVLCGTALNSRVQLWDLRMKLSLQSYYCKSTASSPVYSVTFDPCSLFAALDTSLNVLDFSGNSNIKHDYRSAWGG